MAGTPVTQDDLDSVKDVPIEVAISYLKGPDRRGRARGPDDSRRRRTDAAGPSEQRGR